MNVFVTLDKFNASSISQIIKSLHTSKRVLMTVMGSMQTPATHLAPAPSSMDCKGPGAPSAKKCCFRVKYVLK